MHDFQDRQPDYSARDDFGNSPPRPVPTGRAGLGCAGWAVLLLTTTVLATVVSLLVTLSLIWVFVPAGVGWKRLEYEGTVTVPHGQPFRVEYPGTFSHKPSLHLEPVGPDQWFYKIDEQTETHFTVTNTTVDGPTGTPRFLVLKWKATGSR